MCCGSSTSQRGNFVAGFVFFWACSAIYAENTRSPAGSSGNCVNGEVANIAVPEGCRRVADAAIIAGAIVLFASVVVAIQFVRSS